MLFGCTLFTLIFVFELINPNLKKDLRKLRKAKKVKMIDRNVDLSKEGSNHRRTKVSSTSLSTERNIFFYKNCYKVDSPAYSMR